MSYLRIVLLWMFHLCCIFMMHSLDGEKGTRLLHALFGSTILEDHGKVYNFYSLNVICFTIFHRVDCHTFFKYSFNVFCKWMFFCIIHFKCSFVYNTKENVDIRLRLYDFSMNHKEWTVSSNLCFTIVSPSCSFHTQ